ncbi:MAG: hypothetical protein Q9195_001313 [Heterodermia aff. obscurata]
MICTRPNDTESLIRPLNRNFYPTKIPAQHHQLKNFISTTDPNVIYYASEKEIYALHKKSGKRELIASLPWAPQCLDAAYGWVCVGGPDNGLCAFIYIGDQPEEESVMDTTRSSHSEVDALLPLDLDPESRLLDHHTYHGHQGQIRHGGARKSEVHCHELGTSIVNSVAIYRLRSDQPGLRNQTVVILTNNDQTVRVFSLSQSRVLKRLHFPTPMNHASISPDQELLIAVGDLPRVWFCKRITLASPAEDAETSFANFDWLLFAEPRLSLADLQDSCFTTAFSPSGHICAVASQSGVVTIFDTSLIKNDMDTDEAVIDVLRSTRGISRDRMCGAIRAMSFAPAPWDLLAWAEDQGRVCVTDLRHRFFSRQTIELDVDSPDLNRIHMSAYNDGDRTAEERQMEIQARFIMRQREALAAQNYPAAIDYLEAAAAQSARRRRMIGETQAGTRDVLADFNEDSFLTERERLTLSRDEDNVTGNSQWNPYSLNYAYGAETASSARPSSHSPSSNTPPPGRQENIRDFIRQRSLEHNLERNRPGSRPYQPRRRSSVVISNTNHNSQSPSSHPSNLAPIGAGTPTLSASPSRLASTNTESAASLHNNQQTLTTSTDSDPWQTISDAMAPADPTNAESSHLRREYDESRTRLLERQSLHRPSDHLNRHDRLLRTSNPQRFRSAQYDYPMNPQTSDSARALIREGVLNEGLVMSGIERNSVRPRADGVFTMGIGWDTEGRHL